jgi:hypothetical protein
MGLPYQYAAMLSSLYPEGPKHSSYIDTCAFPDGLPFTRRLSMHVMAPTSAKKCSLPFARLAFEDRSTSNAALASLLSSTRTRRPA